VENGFSAAAIVISSDGMGHGDDTLRVRLLGNYLRTLTEMEQPPRYILMYAAGVRMATRDSPCRKDLDRLSAQGCCIVLCRTCLEHYGLLEQVPEKEVGNMMMIAEAQGDAEKVITL